MSKHELKDDLFFCERCGISFIWAVEEQRQAGTEQPALCAGCRTLLPASGRERGRVRWYNPRKRYGFIVRQGQPPLFMHSSRFIERTHIYPGDLVEFTLGETNKGPCATEIKLLARDQETT